jgi:hypothetical protein
MEFTVQVRAALLRVRNPNTIFAAWASSAPVQAQVDMTSYMETIERSLPRNCSADYAAVTRWVDKGLLGSDKKLAQTIKYELVKARRMNATGETPESRALTKADVAKWDDLGAAMILMDPMSQYQVLYPCPSSLSIQRHKKMLTRYSCSIEVWRTYYHSATSSRPWVAPCHPPLRASTLPTVRRSYSTSSRVLSPNSITIRILHIYLCLPMSRGHGNGALSLVSRIAVAPSGHDS